VRKPSDRRSELFADRTSWPYEGLPWRVADALKLSTPAETERLLMAFSRRSRLGPEPASLPQQTHGREFTRVGDVPRAKNGNKASTDLRHACPSMLAWPHSLRRKAVSKWRRAETFDARCMAKSGSGDGGYWGSASLPSSERSLAGVRGISDSATSSRTTNHEFASTTAACALADFITHASS